MKKIILFILLATASSAEVFAQDANSNIKYYLDQDDIFSLNADLPTAVKNRMFRKFSQLINQTGVAEVGYSTFLISPKLEVNSVNADNAGMAKLYLADCEVTLLIKRTSPGGTSGRGEGIFDSYSKTIVGSGSTKDEAILNALTGLSGKDKDIVQFLSNAKVKITKYYAEHCPEVIKEGKRAKDLKMYQQSIALFFSVPYGAPCYNEAVDLSKEVYATYVSDDCEKQLITMKSYVALAQNNSSYYDSVLNIMKSLSPASKKCFSEAKDIVTKIENRLAGEQKERWAFVKKYYSDQAEIDKEMYKAMGRISSGYQRGGTTNIIVTD